jgi:hypothetical protein
VNNPRPVRSDAVAADLFDKMLASAEFGKLWTRVTAERDRAASRCLRETDLVELRRAQGAAAALTAALGLPAQMLGEMRAGKR